MCCISGKMLSFFLEQAKQTVLSWIKFGFFLFYKVFSVILLLDTCILIAYIANKPTLYISFWSLSQVFTDRP